MAPKQGKKRKESQAQLTAANLTPLSTMHEGKKKYKEKKIITIKIQILKTSPGGSERLFSFPQCLRARHASFLFLPLLFFYTVVGTCLYKPLGAG